MASIAFIVDGDLEKKFLGRICKGTPVRRVGNGHTCPTHVIARQALAEIRIFNNKYNDIVIIVDLEKRNISAEDFERELSTLINNQNPTNACVHVFSKDKCVEDWILADSTSVEKYIGSKVDTSQLSGKGGLKKLPVYPLDTPRTNRVQNGFRRLLTTLPVATCPESGYQDAWNRNPYA